MGNTITIGNSIYSVIEERMARGGMLLRDPDTGLLYVRKILPVYDMGVYDYLARFAPVGIPRIKSLTVISEGLEVLEEYISGETLEDIIRRTGPFEQSTAVSILKSLCLILTPLHYHKPAIVHRDIKPSNVMLSSEGSVYLLDFDAATRYDDAKDEDTILIGTHGYAAPEQYGFRASDPRTDVYAIGRLAQMLLTGELTSSEDYNGPLARIIRKSLSLDPKDRYADAAELGHAFDNSPITRSWALPGFRTRRPWKMLLASIWYFFIFAGFFISLFEEDNTNKIADVIQLLWLTSVTLTAFNYRNWLALLPFTESESKYVRIISRIAYTMIVFLIFFFLEGLALRFGPQR